MELLTQRLKLRLLNKQDWNFFQNLNQNHQAMRYVADIPDEQRLRNLFESRIETWEKGKDSYLSFVIERLDNKEPIGLHGLKGFAENQQQAELGFILHPNYQGQGFALEATKAVIEFALKAMGYQALVATVTDGNTASLGLLYKLGFVHYQTIKQNFKINNIWHDDIVLMLNA
ncbi:GNAT family N-acetyltransferase [Pseudoalteromonas luteoviolacea]|uniref:GNAT family N-acetyltransferase n=1 Tax=Pseudoalteromonas luteoviolacea TaxID=43657 RepID=UPI001154B8DD|nr:GNAT family protein [Pseudoalteromonas luteoviolacea]TQF67951.1 GNAT family N-acetyltransferase [Pseudoalteromonas luteoviolacea]